MITRTCYHQLQLSERGERSHVRANASSIGAKGRASGFDPYGVRLILETCGKNKTPNIIVSDCNEMSCST